MHDAGRRRSGPGRPPASTRGAVEAIAIELLLREGYASVTVDEIAKAAGIGRTTFFRYFPTKADVVWRAFDGAIGHLERGLEQADPEAPASVAIRDAVVASTREATDARGVWLDRFELLDTAPALRASAEEHWSAWRGCVARFVARRINGAPADVLPMATAGAMHGVYVAELRDWVSARGGPSALLDRLSASVTLVGQAFDPLLTATAQSDPRV